MKPLNLKDHEVVVIIREAKDPYPYGPDRVFEAVFPDMNTNPRGYIDCVPVIMKADGAKLCLPEGFGNMDYRYYASCTKPVDNELAERIAKFVEDHYQSTDDPWKLVVRRKMFHGNSQRRAKYVDAVE